MKRIFPPTSRIFIISSLETISLWAKDITQTSSVMPPPPICDTTQRIIVLQLYIIATPEFLHHKKYFNWHLVPKTISDISPRIQLFYFRCGWPSLLTNISMRVDVPRRIKVITGKNCCVYVCVCVCNRPTEREVCTYYEVMVFQPRTVIPPHLASVAYRYTFKLSLPTHLFILPFYGLFFPHLSYRLPIRSCSLSNTSRF